MNIVKEYKYLPKNTIITNSSDSGHYLLQCDCLDEHHTMFINAYIDEDQLEYSSLDLSIPVSKAYGIRWRLKSAYDYVMGKPIPHGMGNTILLTQGMQKQEILHKLITIVQSFRDEVLDRMKVKDINNLNNQEYILRVDGHKDKIPEKKSNFRENIDTLRISIADYLIKYPDLKYDWMTDVKDRLASLIKPNWILYYDYTMYNFESIEEVSKHSFSYDKEFVITKSECLNHKFFDLSFSWQFSKKFGCLKRVWKALKYSFGYAFPNFHYETLMFNYQDVNKLLEVLQYISMRSNVYHEATILSAKDWKAFNDLIGDPPDPIDKLTNAVASLENITTELEDAVEKYNETMKKIRD